MLMFFNGFLVGIGSIIAITIVALKGIDNAITKELFVKQLIEEKGWEGARWELQTSFGHSYMKIWKKLRKEHFTYGNK